MLDYIFIPLGIGMVVFLLVRSIARVIGWVLGKSVKALFNRPKTSIREFKRAYKEARQ